MTISGPVAPPPLARQRNAILLVLVVLAAAGWVVFLNQTKRPMGMAHEMGPNLTMGRSWPLFLAMWIAMMTAMMFPAAAPMITMYARMRRRDPASIAIFTGSYMLLWFVFGVVGYLVGAGIESAASGSDWVAANWGRVGGALIVLAGVYQLTPLKQSCLRQCRTPLSFVMTRWRDGRVGAARMGLLHGVYCMGCCWLLFLILVPIGVMNVAAMIAIAALVFAEKVVPGGWVIGQAAAAALVVYGVAVAAHPALLPTVA